MRISYAGAAAAVMMTIGAGAASAQPYSGYGQLPPAPYMEAGGYGGGYGGEAGGCGDSSFTLLGARAGVTVLGFDLGANAHFSAPTGQACGGGGGYAPSYPPAPEAPPPVPMGYGPPPSYGEAPPPYGYAPMQPPMQGGWGYAPPCGCETRGW